MQCRQHVRNRIRTGRVLVGLLVFTLLLSGCGASAPRVYRVGILSGLDFFAQSIDGFKARMTDLGYIEGQNITYDIQKTNFDIAAYRRVAQKFVADKVDLIFVFPTEATLEAKAVTQGTNIPVVFALVFTEGTDLIKSVREPGGNITGVRYPGTDIALKRFEVLHKLVPQAKRFWVPYQRGYPTVPIQLEALRPVAASAGVTLVEMPANNAADLEADLQAREKAADIGIDAILIISEPLGGTPDAFTILATFATKHKLPIDGGPVVMGNYGSVISITPNNVAVGKQAATLADKIFKGTPAGTIPVFTPESDLLINYKIAQDLGLQVPEELLRQANEIIR